MKILIIGRPNTGKSSLFNKLARERKSLVMNKPGLTRDILKSSALWWGKKFEIWDSGGYLSHDKRWGKAIDEQVESHLKTADKVLFVLDGRAGLMPEDKEIFRKLKKNKAPFLALVNKLDTLKAEKLFLNDFYELGCPLKACAFESHKAVADIVKWIIQKKTGKSSSKPLVKKYFYILTAGRVNAGKSSLCNALLKKKRSIVSSQAGTTTDVVEEVFSYRQKKYVLMDTAGFQKQSPAPGPASLSLYKTKQNFEKAHLVWLVIDSVKGFSRQEARIADLCKKQHKALILVAAKWDKKAHKEKTFSKIQLRQIIKDKWAGLFYTPVVFTSSWEKKGFGQLLKVTEEILKKMFLKIPVRELNAFLNQVIKKTPLPVYGVDNVKFYSIAQQENLPLVFNIFVNQPKGVKDSYLRFLAKQIQNRWGLKSTPVKLIVLKHKKKGCLKTPFFV